MSKILQKNDQRIYSCYQSRILLILQQFNQVTKSTNQKSSSTKKSWGEHIRKLLQIGSRVLSSSRSCNGVVDGQIVLTRTNIQRTQVQRRVNRVSWYFIRTPFSNSFCSFLNGDRVLDFLNNFGDRWSHAPVWLNAHQSFLGYLPHWLDIVVVQCGVDYSLYVPTLNMQLCLWQDLVQKELFRLL